MSQLSGRVMINLKHAVDTARRANSVAIRQRTAPAENNLLRRNARE